jgi:hypothetical protein
VCVRARKRTRESGWESGGWEKILEKRVKCMRESLAREETSASASSESDWESVRESASSESGWDLRILENMRVKYMRERARDSARESAACLRVRV